MNGKNYLTLCTKSLTGELTKEEEKIFMDWLDDSDQNQKNFESLKSFWNRTGINLDSLPIDVDADWESLDRRIGLNERKIPNHGFINNLNKVINLILLPKYKPVIATMTLVLLVTLSLIVFKKDQVKPQQISLITSAQELRSIILPDGSFVTLNNSSKLDYANSFTEKTREVFLKGEAFFSVKKDGRPFIIKTLNAKTTVIGTKFNVWARDERTRVSVVEGKVKLANVKNSDPVYLTRNQQSTVIQESKPTTPTNVDSDFLVEWLNNKLVFSNSPLDEVVEELQGYYSTKIRIEGSNLASYNLTGSFKNRDVDSVLTMICLALDVRYTKNNEGFVIKLRN